MEGMKKTDKALYQAKQSVKSKVAVLRADGLSYLIDVSRVRNSEKLEIP